MAHRSNQVPLPCPGVELDAAFVRRLERLVLRFEAARERREGAGAAALAGGGDEFVGYRPYRPGEDLRLLDWSLYARLDRPYVRSTRREASEHWAILVDGSASMGVGPPGKLQCAAELTAALASLGLRQGARLTLAVSAAQPRLLGLRTPRDLPRLYAFLRDLYAHGPAGLASILARARLAQAGRVFLLGDFIDLDPRVLLELRGRRRELVLAQILAPIELAPPAAGQFEWVCPESGARVRVGLDARKLAQYARELELSLERWAASAARHAARYRLVRSDQPFEEALEQLLR